MYKKYCTRKVTMATREREGRIASHPTLFSVLLFLFEHCAAALHRFAVQERRDPCKVSLGIVSQ